ncbi:hypothetical protein BDV32DRAFT_90643 [Aspergillus pseudonomiae]|uniref:Uncharacterized protein n=1 Tax=Aspergillus pseudonomiae TaxID=1506151 RepID=A0A5N7CUB3_9EURO|nr:uncharacterized protein BDV37DRAFT_48786 [Aspergillus pseudonomiae]KAB8256813.1 hypothetical protein BDV32DRAFT_90643 [Aspergillus pseudonomiae]KAE8397772.1 hypothetical protein BDV37DRAFT_48786 [Aspergillus pseudonomiae]
MFPTFHINNFKPWAPPHTKPFPPHKSLTSRAPRTPIPTPKLDTPPPYKPRHDSFPSTLPTPKHCLPARPPAEVCLRISADTRPCTLNSQPPLRECSIPLPNTLSSKIPEHGTISTCYPVDRTSNSDPIPPCYLEDITDAPIEPPFLPEDTAGVGQSSPSTSSEDSLEEFSFPGLQSNIPIDPVILADNKPWEEEASGLHQHIQQCDDLMFPETICPYPEPPTLCDTPDQLRSPSKDPGSQGGNTKTSDHPRTQGHRQLNSSNHNSEADTSCSNDTSENLHGEQSKKHKRKTQRSGSGGRAAKRIRLPLRLPTREHSFTGLRSHFLSLPLDERLQFLSWLFEGALPRCMSDYSLTVSEQEDARAASHSTLPDVIEQAPRGSMEVIENSRKGIKWSPEEDTLLLKLKKYEKRSWKEIERLFSEEYPGRSLGAIQVHWSTTFRRKED